MLSRATSNSRWASAMSAKHLLFGKKQNGGCVLPTCLIFFHVTFFLFPGMNPDLKGWHFADTAEVQWSISGGPLQHFCWRCFQQWEWCWDHWIQSQEGILWRGLKFKTCTTVLNKIFLTIPGIFGSPLIHIMGKTWIFSDILAPILCICVTNLHETWYTHTTEGITIIMIMYCIFLPAAIRTWRVCEFAECKHVDLNVMYIQIYSTSDPIKFFNRILNLLCSNYHNMVMNIKFSSAVFMVVTNQTPGYQHVKWSIKRSLTHTHTRNNIYEILFMSHPPPLKGNPSLMQWWGLRRHMFPRSMLVIVYATGRPSHVRQDDPDEKGYPGPPSCGGWAWG